MNKENIDKKVVRDFGREWKAFNHQDIDTSLLDSGFDSYFHIFPFDSIKNFDNKWLDMGMLNARIRFLLKNINPY